MKTKTELKNIIIAAEEELHDGVNASGFKWDEVAKRCEDAKAELFERFGMAVSYGGILTKVGE